MEAGTDDRCTIRYCTLISAIAVERHDDMYFLIPELIYETRDEVCLLRHQKGRKYRIVIIPAPTLAKTCLVFHRYIGDNLASDSVDTKTAHTLCKGVHVVAAKTGVHASYTVDVTNESTSFDNTFII